MTIKQAWKKLQRDKNATLSRYLTFNIDFINSDGDSDETQFTVELGSWYRIPDELTALFKEFCKENGFKTNTVTSITWVMEEPIKNTSAKKKRIVAVLEMDEELLKDTENGDIEKAFGWCAGSGLYLQEYETYEDGELIPDIIKRGDAQEEIDSQRKESIKKDEDIFRRFHKSSSDCILDRFTKDELLMEAKTLEECGEYLHYSLMGYTAEELRQFVATKEPKTCHK